MKGRLQLLLRVFAALVFIGGLSIQQQTFAQTTLFSEDFTGESGTSGTSAEGISWSASGGAGTGGVSGNAYMWTPSSNGSTTTWQTGAIDLTGYTNLQVSFDYTESNANGQAVISMTNATINGSSSVVHSSGVSFTGTVIASGSSTVISIALSQNKNKNVTIDNVTLTGAAVISGCTDSGACNYNASANSDDGSCTYASTWYADADGDGLGDAGSSTSSCTQPAGYVADSSDNCDDTSACNYDDAGNPSCTFAATYYDCAGICLNDTDGDGVCNELEIAGCTNASACNYDASATDDDGSCILSGVQFEFTLTVDNFPEDIAWYMVDDDAATTLIWGTGGSVANPTELSAGSVPDGETLVYTSCFAASGSYSLFISDSYGDGLLGTNAQSTVPGWTLVVGTSPGTTVSNISGPIDIDVGAPYEISIDFGCTDSGAVGYDAAANVDDGSCSYPGCTDSSACNYDASASSDDGSCTYATTWYDDTDGDGFGDPNTTQSACDQPAGFVANNTDECPSDGALGAAPTWYQDTDGDGAGDPAVTQTACTQPAGYVAVAGDGCPSDPNKTSAGTCGCGNPDTDTDGDGTPDCNDTDDDNDGVLDGVDTAPLDPDVCADADGDGCDDCSVGTDGFGPLADNTPANDGTDTDGDGICDSGDTDDDGDGVSDGADSAPLNPNVCSDTDADGCDDCSSGTYDPANDGTDTDSDGLCDSGDPDDDNDGVVDGSDSAPLNPNVCSDSDGDGCDDCSSGSYDPANDGTDFDGDGLCDSGDPDDDNDGALDGVDSDDNNANVCSDTDGDGCDDCTNGSYDPANDGTDTDGDGTCDSGDACPSDPNKIAPGICGCGVVDVDVNENGICDGDECIDSESPVALAQDVTLYLNASGNATLLVAQVDNGSSDDCAGLVLSLDITAFDCTDVGSPTTVTLTATDVASNVSTATATITVLDTIAPVVTASNATVALDATGSYTLEKTGISASASDVCTASPTLELSLDNSTWSSTLAIGCAQIGATSVYVRATDASGNVSSSSTVTLTVEDNTAPVISSLTSGATEVLSGAAVTINASSYITATDECTASGSLTYQISETTGSGFASSFEADCADLGPKTFYFRVLDASGNTSAESSTSITIADQTAPVISSVTGASISLDGNGDATITASSSYVTASDNCTAAGSMTYLLSTASDGTYASTLAVDCADLGGLNLYIKAQDASGNLSTASSAASFTIEDTTGPTATASNATVSLDSNGDYTLLPATLSVGATDNCSASFTYSLSKDEVTWSSSLAYTCSDAGAVTVYVRANDGTNDGPSTSVTLTLQDDQAPTVTASNATANLDGAGSVTISAADVSASVTDNCAGVADVELSHNNASWASTLTFDCDSVGARTVYYRVSDGTNTSSSASVTLTITDAIGPTFSTPGGAYALSSGAVTVTFAQVTGSSVADNCDAGGDLTVQISKTDSDWGTATSSVDFGCFDLGAQTVYLKATDSVGNETTGSVSITITGTDVDSDGICDASDLCTNTDACNYDGSTYANEACDIPADCNTCSGGAVVVNSVQFVLDFTHDRYASETSWTMTNGSGTTVFSSPTFTNYGANGEYNVVYPADSCMQAVGTYTLTINDSYGDGICCAYGNGQWTLEVGDWSYNSPAVSGWTNTDVITVTFGCMDASADNYNASADIDNGTCNYLGCTDDTACNYDAAANVDDGTCTFATVWYEDADSDGAGDPNTTVSACTQPAGYIAVAGDECPSDANKTTAGVCGCGTPDTDTDSDGTPDCNDTDDDNDGVLDGADTAPLDPNVCADADGDGCDDCSVGTDGFGPLADNTPANDGTDTDGDGLCDSGDTDDDGDGVLDGADSAPLNPNVCSDTDADGCDDCANGTYDPANDGTDTDADGICDSGDGCPNDPNKTAPGVCGCGNVEQDVNENGICDTEECFDGANPVAATNDTTLYLDAAGNASVTAAGINNGSTDDCLPIASYALDISAFDCSDIGTPVTVTLTVTDGVGNTDTETATVTVLDNTAPTPSASSATVSLSGSGYTLTAAAISASATDNCTASPTLELSKDDTNWSSTLSYTCLDKGANTVYVRATDGSGNVSTSTSVTLTIEDTTNPTISSITSGLTEILSGAGSATIDASSYVTASDNCTSSGNFTYEISETDGSGYAATFVADCADIGAKTFYFRVTDESGNSSTGSEVITIADQTAPTISSVSGATVNLDANGDATITASDTYVTATDNCTASGSLTYLVSRASDGTFTSTLAVDCADLGSLDLYFKAQDAEGNTSAASSAATFTIADVTGPTASASNATVSLNGSGAYTLLPLILAASSTDNCESSMTYALSKDDTNWSSSLSYSCSDVGANTVYVRASDGTNDGASVSVTLTVQDNTAPTVSASNTTVSLDGTGSLTLSTSDISASASDNCEASPTVQLSHNNSTWASTLTFDCDSIGARTVYYRASDGTNTSASSSVTVTVQDATGPTFSTPGGSYAIASGSVQVFFYQPSGSSLADNCDAAGNITKQASKTGTDWETATASVTYDCTEVGAQTIYLRATDSYGNATTSTASITITSAAPTISSVLSGQTEALGSDGTVVIDASSYITATDDCSSAGNMTYEISETSGSGFSTTFTADCADIGSKTFYFRVTDESSATSTESSESITIADQTAPSVTGVNNTIYLDASGAATLWPDSFLTVSDNCTPEASIALTMALSAGGSEFFSSIPVDCSNLGTTTYKFSAVDASGNSSGTETTAQVTVADNIAPTVVANNITLNLVSTSVTLDASNATFNTSTDNDTCSALTSTITVDGGLIPASSYDFSAIGTYAVTLEVTDASGNSSQDVATVTVTTAPTSLWSEDFEDDAAGTMCSAAGDVSSFDSNFTVECVGSSTAGPADVTGGTRQFEFAGGEGNAIRTPVINISGYIAEFNFDVGSVNLNNNKSMTLYQNLDGAGYSAVGTFGTCTGCSAASGSYMVSNVIGSTVSYRFEITANSQTSRKFLLDNLVIQGCEDLDGDGICDPVDDCVDFPAGACGCTDQTACNYDAAATTDDGSCYTPGMSCQAPSESTGYVYEPAASGQGCDCNEVAATQLYIEPFDDENGGAQLQLCTSGYTANASNWTFDCAGASTGAYIYASPSGGGFSFNVYNTTNVVLTTADIDVSGYANAYVSAVVEQSPSALEANDGWTISVIEDGTNTGTLVSKLDDTPEITIGGGVNVASVSTLAVAVEGDADAEDIFIDDITVHGFGVAGCMDASATNYNASATSDDGSCTLPTAYSFYSGGFSDKLWKGSACPGGPEGCGTAPFLDAIAVASSAQTDLTNFNYHISSGTTVTVDGTQIENSAYVLHVRDLYVEDGGLVNIPQGYVLKVMGTFTAMDSDPFTGDGEVCFLGDFTIPDGEGAPDSVGVGNVDFPATGSLTLPNGKVVTVSGNVGFDAVPPVSMNGKLVLKGSATQTVTGAGATFDDLEIDNPAGVTFEGSSKVKGRLVIKDGAVLNLGANAMRLRSTASGTALLDPIPATASITGSGVPAGGGRMSAAMSQSAQPKFEVERYIAPDDDGITYFGFTMYGCPIDGATVSDLNGSTDFYTSGWPGSAYPNSTSTVQFWNEVTGSIEGPSSENESLSDRGCWVMSYGSQSPTMLASGALNDHKIGGTAKTFTLTRQGPSAEFEGWNMIFNPYQAILDWDAVIEGAGHGDVIEDQFAIYDTQDKRFRRYGKSTAGVSWSNDTEAGEDSIAMRYINPGQAFWVRVKDGVSSGTLTLDPSMIDNDATAVNYIRDVADGTTEVLLEIENVYGANRVLLTFSETGSTEEQLDGDMSFIRSTSIRSGEAAFVVGDQKYVSKTLPLKAFDGELYVESKANRVTTIRVVETLGEMPVCVHIMDNATGEVLVLQEGEELEFTLPNDAAEEGRFTLHSVPFGTVEGLSPECPDSEEGMIVMELGEAVADLTVTDYNSMEVVSLLYQQTGTVEIPIAPGEYAIMVLADEETSLCRGGRRQVVVAPGEQPELLGVGPMPAACNEGMASLAFELYGSGDYQTELMQGNASIWSATLPAGEHLLSDIEPGDYILKVDHVCLETFEWVSLLDPFAVDVNLEFNGFVEVDANGGGWLEASCADCLIGEGYGYTWALDGEPVGANAPLSIRVEQAGTYSLELLTYGTECDVVSPFEITVGKNKLEYASGVDWLGIQNGMLGVSLDDEWKGASVRGYDATGRLVLSNYLGDVFGENFIALPDHSGWLTIELSDFDGRTVRWTGIH